MLRRLSTSATQALTLAQHQSHCTRPCGLAWLQHRGFADSPVQEQEKGSWMPQWIRNRLPPALGGDKDIAALESLDLDSYASSLKQARRLGSVTGFVGGTSAISDPVAQGNLRLYENIIGAMLPEEKKDLSLFGASARRRVAAEVDCTVGQVDDCIAKYQWMKQTSSRMAALKRSGKPLPKSPEEMERSLGNWRGFKQQQLQQQDPQGTSTGGLVVPMNMLGPKERPCPLAGHTVGRNTKCPLTRKTYKACCGKGQVSRR